MGFTIVPGNRRDNKDATYRTAGQPKGIELRFDNDNLLDVVADATSVQEQLISPRGPTLTRPGSLRQLLGCDLRS